MLQNEVTCSLTLLQFGNYFNCDIWACIGNWNRDIWACILWNSGMSFSAYKPRSHVFNMTAPCMHAVRNIEQLLKSIFDFRCEICTFCDDGFKNDFLSKRC